MTNVFLVQSVDMDTYRKLAKDGVKVHDFDCYAVVTTLYVCKSYEQAVQDCRRDNRKQTISRYFVNVVCCF